MSAEPLAGHVERVSGAPAGLYVHIPFCHKVCPYCDFAVTATRRPPHEGYARALAEECRVRAEELRDRDVQTIYWGGGTPSRWEPAAMALFSDAMWRIIDRETIQEFTMEANPSDITEEAARTWRALGVDRLSVGVQSFEDEILGRLGRNHDGARAEQALRCAAGHGMRLSMDLIFGAPDQSVESWRRDLMRVEALIEQGVVGHLSAYNLTYEPDTPFGRALAAGRMREAPEERVVEMIEALSERARGWGFEHVEVSSWSGPGQHSRHNALYWSGAEYVGIGVGAHSLAIDEGVVERRENTRHIARYLRDPIDTCRRERIAPSEHVIERVYTGIRTKRGVSWGEIARQFERAISPQALDALRARLDRMVAHGLLSCAGQGPRYAATERGMWVADALGEGLV